MDGQPTHSVGTIIRAAAFHVAFHHRIILHTGKESSLLVHEAGRERFAGPHDVLLLLDARAGLRLWIARSAAAAPLQCVVIGLGNILSVPHLIRIVELEGWRGV